MTFKPTPKTKEPGTSYSIMVTDPTRDKLTELAKLNGLTVHNLIRQMINYCIGEKEDQ